MDSSSEPTDLDGDEQAKPTEPTPSATAGLEAPTQPEPDQDRDSPTAREPDEAANTTIRIGAVVAIALLAGFLVWLLLIRGDSSAVQPPNRAAGEPVSIAELTTLASRNNLTVYWVGPRQGVTYELTETSSGQVYVRYLPQGEDVGSKNAFLTVGTYPIPDAFAITSAASRKAGSVDVPVNDGGVAFYSEATPTSVYLAYPGSDYQVEVYDPLPERARELVSSGQVEPVRPTTGSASAQGPRGVSPAGLATLAASLDDPIYWIGRAPETTYEATRTTSGVYVRYLPTGTPVGSKAPYLTIGSYPLPDAFAVTTEKSKAAGAVRVPTTSGGVAFYSEAQPTNIYVAYPNVDVQIEVYDPTAAKARAIVESGRLKHVG